jgi:hypothetical protein
VRVDFFTSYLAMRADHIAACPSVSPPDCAKQDIKPHWHRQRIDWLRANALVNVGLGDGWQATFGLPFDVKIMRIKYETIGGQPFEVPYGNIHHRNEVLWGLSDGRLILWRFGHVADQVVVGLGLGSSLPFGRTYDDPFTLGAEGKEHQHFQHGTGTFDPLVSANAMVSGERWGGWSTFSLRLPLYANGKGYRPPLSVVVSAGPSIRVIRQLQFLVTADYSYTGPEHWNGTPYGGRMALAATGGVLVSASPNLVFQLFGQGTIWQQAVVDREAELLKQSVVVTGGFSWSPKLLKKKLKGE